jgi:hypothetical protein
LSNSIDNDIYNSMWLIIKLGSERSSTGSGGRESGEGFLGEAELVLDFEDWVEWVSGEESRIRWRVDYALSKSPGRYFEYS